MFKKQITIKFKRQVKAKEINDTRDYMYMATILLF